MANDPIILSHRPQGLSWEAAKAATAERLKREGDKPYATVPELLAMLDAFVEHEVGRFLLTHQGLNGYWTSFMISPPLIEDPLLNWMLYGSPTVLATRERFAHFLKAAQQEVKDGVVMASLPCGVMDDLLKLDFSQHTPGRLVGIDLDAESLALARENSEKCGLAAHCAFELRDAWALNDSSRFDVILSNGLNFYEPNPDRVTGLYSRFFQALKPGGCLITSILTPPPTVSQDSPWRIDLINPADLKKQRMLFVDIIQATWTGYCLPAVMTQQLQTIGFAPPTFVWDRAGIFPTVIARKP